MSHAPLNSPGKIGSLTLKNRFVLAAMGSNFATPDGHCSEQLIAYYEARAKGGGTVDFRDHLGKLAVGLFNAQHGRLFR